LETGQANLRAGAFAGTADAYLRYRPPYPKALLDDLLRRAAPPSGGELLDLACGPGRVALDLAGSFAAVWAIDLEPEMIEVGRREAARRGIGSVTWLVGWAEELELAPNSIDLITIGEAFHRLDQVLIAEKALGWLRPGGSLATLGTDGILDGREPWQKTVAEVARRWMSRAFPEGWAKGRPGADLGRGAAERVLGAAGFAQVASRAFREPQDWSVEEIIGYLQSTSVCSKVALGEDFPRFEADLRAALSNEPAALFHEELGCGYTLGRKPTG
jgi:SAM-dependent methyltransferase